MGIVDHVTFEAPVYLKYDRRFWSINDDFEGWHSKAIDEEACSCRIRLQFILASIHFISAVVCVYTAYSAILIILLLRAKNSDKNK